MRKKWFLILFLFNTFDAGGFPSILDRIKDNFHKVDGYELYRSRQLGYQKEKKYIQAKGIKIILGLRGAYPNVSWWEQQKKAADETGATFICAQTSKSRYPSLHSLLIMLAVIHNPKGVINNAEDVQKNPLKYVFDSKASTKDDIGRKIPIKVNCQFGADRTSLFCALFVMEREFLKNNIQTTDYILKRGKKEYRLKHGHVRMASPKINKFVNEWWKIRDGKSLEQALEIYKKRTVVSKPIFYVIKTQLKRLLVALNLNGY